MVLAVMWVYLLITVSSIKEYRWFLLAVGAVGIVYIAVVAGALRRPEAFGIPLDFKTVYVKDYAIDALQVVEAGYPGVGQSLLQVFFPDRLPKLYNA